MKRFKKNVTISVLAICVLFTMSSCKKNMQKEASTNTQYFIEVEVREIETNIGGFDVFEIETSKEFYEKFQKGDFIEPKIPDEIWKRDEPNKYKLKVISKHIRTT